MDPSENLNKGSFSLSMAPVDHCSGRSITGCAPTKLVDNFRVYCILRKRLFERKRRR
jgi:hypothetical protein